jgi:hypothetical protein
MSSTQDAPFLPPTSLLSLLGQFPSPEVFRAALSNASRQGRERIVRLWISEGIPHAFQKCPALYEEIRTWLAPQVGTEPKNITLIGSARLGYSLKPGAAWGRPFGPHSDIDLSIVCTRLFEQLTSEFDQFASEYRGGQIHPRNPLETANWDANLSVVPRGIVRGAIDPRKIPTWNRFPCSQKIGTATWRVNKRLTVSEDAPRVRKLSVRVYRDWVSFAEIVSTNLGRAAAA